MYQFIHGSDAAFNDLAHRVRRACIVFHNQEMPPGSVPAMARIGFEVDAADGTARLLVDRNIHYEGMNASVQEWLQRGEKQFATFRNLQTWIQHELRACYPAREPHPGLETVDATDDSEAVATPAPGDLTDLDAVHVQTPAAAHHGYLDADGLYAALAADVRGQEPALRLLARRICRHLARCNPRRPATFFAIGPTGVGKTKTGETLPHALRVLDPNSAGYSYLRLDMSEFQERYRISQLIGAPPGYVGYDDGAQLTASLIANPRTIVLFDEIEKAHSAVLRALMNAMDAGRLSAPNGQSEQQWQVDCRRAIFLFTSNLDATNILRELAAHRDGNNMALVDRVCRQRLRAAGVSPELVGRISCFLVFHPLSAEARAEIVALTVARVAEEYGLQVGIIAPDVITHILDVGGDTAFGVRPYEYLVDDLLGEAFARTVASGEHTAVTVEGGPPFYCTPLHELNDGEREA